MALCLENTDSGRRGGNVRQNERRKNNIKLYKKVRNTPSRVKKIRRKSNDTHK